MAAAGSSLSERDIPAEEHVLRVERKGVARDQLGPTVNAAAIQLLVFAAENKVTPGVGYTVHTSHGAECDIAVCLPVDKAVEPKEGMSVGAAAGGKASAATYKGTYDQFYDDDALLAGKHADLKDAPKEVRLYYKVGPKEKPSSPDEWETDLVYLL